MFANWKIFLEFFFQKYFFQKYFCDNIFGENILVKIFFDHSLITKGFPFLTKFPLLHLHPFEVKCDKLTDARTQ